MLGFRDAQLAEAVLRADGTAKVGHHVMDDAVDLAGARPAHVVGPVSGHDRIVVEVAVAHMAEGEGQDAGEAGGERRIGPFDEGGDGGDGHADVVLHALARLGLRFRLRLESREVVLKPNLPQRGDKDENKRNPPQIMVLSSGDVSPFELEIEREGQPALWRVTALPDNNLRVEIRDDRNQWGPLLETKPPKDDKKQPTRVSSAR